MMNNLLAKKGSQQTWCWLVKRYVQCMLASLMYYAILHSACRTFTDVIETADEATYTELKEKLGKEWNKEKPKH